MTPFKPVLPILRSWVCKMLPTQREFMAGITRFEGFPPAVLFGLGGVLAEALKDFTLRLAPMTRDEGPGNGGLFKSPGVAG